jgi:predicted acyltransferase
MNSEINKSTKSNRLASIDAFRGATIAGMIIVINPGSWKYIYTPLRHADWNGLTLADLVYPFFLFVVGVSITFSFSKILEQNISKKNLYPKIIRRSIILFLLGLFINTFPDFDLINIRIMGVLQRIALCYLIVSLIFLNTKLSTQIILSLLFLSIYWAIMELVLVPEVGYGIYEKGRNAAAYLDKFILAGHMGYYEKMGEPEGFISTLPSLSTTMFGVFAGFLLKKKENPYKSISIFLSFGIAGIILGLLWSIWLPINKNLWTSSYSVFTAGIALVVYSSFYYFIDILDFKKLAKPFIVFGTNAITVYVLSIVFAKLINLPKFNSTDGNSYHIKALFYNNILAPIFGNYNASLVYAVLYTTIWCGLIWIMYNKKIFIKV